MNVVFMAIPEDEINNNPGFNQQDQNPGYYSKIKLRKIITGF